MTSPVPADVLASGDFNSTTVTVTPNTDRGVEFFRQHFGCAGVAPVAIHLPKTRWSDFVVHVGRIGLRAE